MPALFQAGLTSPSPSTSAFSILLRAPSATQSTAALETLEATILESSFSDRLFYSPFISLVHFPLSKARSRSGPSLSQAVGLLEMQVRVGRVMLEAVQEARDAGERGGESIVRDVVVRLERELIVGLGLIIRGQAKHGLVVDGVDELGASLFRLVDQFAEESSPLWPVSFALELCQLVQSLNATSPSDTTASTTTAIFRLRTLHTIGTTVSSSSDDGAHSHSASLAAALLSAMPPLLRHLTSSDFLALSQELSRANLAALDLALLERVIQGHCALVDVRAARGHQVVDAGVLQERLACAARAGGGVASSVGHVQGRTTGAHLSSDAAHPLSQAFSPLLERSKLGGRARMEQGRTAQRTARPLFAPIAQQLGSVGSGEGGSEAGTIDVDADEEDEEEDADQIQDHHVSRLTRD